ncbi:formate dehydrogenase subunit gamma [Enterovirga aerilata]|uniref:Formate dehydrogenase subunit gamma n=1 Tax=Enterovirga aerilata TaxID=2730920 RepID=A0A849I450_9HYPH|nr:formate dehydrogenase subunit gamma [Enterovirga sp. DB1703]NNM72444.1 formate dehydrogenase subunit gamma [Enterovirga sp. DB1703]
MSASIREAPSRAEPKVTVSRYSALTRLNHWTLAGSFVLLALTGLALFHPSLYWLTALFGGGQTTRWLHPWVGVVLMLAWLVMFLRFLPYNLPDRTDIAWLKEGKAILSGDEGNVPEVGRYNAGQKFVFWSFGLLVPALFLTGLVIWDQYFYGWTTIPQKRAAILAHALLAVGMISIWILHAYAAVWVRGTLRAMTRGYVTGGWAWRHHRKWLRDMVTGRERRREGVTPAQ